MKPKKIASGMQAILLALLLAGILTIVNLYANQNFFRIDLTQNRRYTIAESTRNILTGLDDIVTIKVYLSRKLPPYVTPMADQIKAMLEEYRVYAKGMLSIEYIDPVDDPTLQRSLQFMGIPQLQLNIIERDQAAIANVYMGLAVLYGDKKEIIATLDNLGRLEYDLTGKILRVTREQDQTIGFLSGHGEPDLRRGLRTVSQLLKDQYFTRTVPTASGKLIDAEKVSALVVAAPQALSDRDLFLIDQYIMAGGRVLFLVDGVALDESMQATPIHSPLSGLLAHYGIRVLPQLVLDQSNVTASFQSGMRDIMLPYPFWVRVVRDMSTSQHPVSSIESMVMPWVSPLIVADNATGNRKVAVLAQSSASSWVQQEVFDLNPQQNFSFNKIQPGRKILAVALSGNFTSWFTDHKTVPPLPGGKPLQDIPLKIISPSPDTRIIVTGSSRFITDEFTQEFEGNRAFFLNAIDWLTIGDELIGIRSRETGERPLKLVSERTKMLVRIVNMLALPLLVTAFGFIYTALRRRRNRREARIITKGS